MTRRMRGKDTHEAEDEDFLLNTVYVSYIVETLVFTSVCLLCSLAVPLHRVDTNSHESWLKDLHHLKIFDGPG